MSTLVQTRPTDKTDCEVCDYKFNKEAYIASETNGEKNPSLGPCVSYGGIIFCPSCLAKEKEALARTEATAPERVIEQAAKRVEPIGSRAEYFNSKTQSINDRRKAIDADTEIKDKDWTEAQELLEWLNKTKQNLFELKQKEEEEVASQNAIQVRLNQLANNLRAEQREQLKLKDINYKPAEVAKPKAPKVSKPKTFDKVALEEASKKHGIPTGVLQTLCVAYKCSVDDAVKKFLAAKK